MSGASLARPIALLSAAAFVSVASMRVSDPLLPQVAQEFGVSAGEASVIATAFALAYGLCQLIWGALGDRFGKFRLVALMTLVSACTVALAGFASSLATLGAARLVAGATAAAIVPLALAFIGDHETIACHMGDGFHVANILDPYLAQYLAAFAKFDDIRRFVQYSEQCIGTGVVGEA